MRSKEIPVGRVTREATADVVKYAAFPHLYKSFFCHFLCSFIAINLCVIHQEHQLVRNRELRCRAESTVNTIIALAEHLSGSFNYVTIDFICFDRFCIFQHIGYIFRRLNELFTFCIPLHYDRIEYIAEAWHTKARGGRKVSSCKKRLFVPRHKNTHRPAATAGKSLTYRHIHAVNVGTLFAVNFYRNEVFIQQFSCFGILKALMCHNMTPMAGAVTDTQENRLILRLCPFKCLAAPRIPVNRIVCVLKQIRTCFIFQMIHIHSPCII